MSFINFNTAIVEVIRLLDIGKLLGAKSKVSNLSANLYKTDIIQIKAIVCLLYGEILQQLGYFQEAIYKYDEALPYLLQIGLVPSDPNDFTTRGWTDYYLNRGICLTQLNKNGSENACKAYRKALKSIKKNNDVFRKGLLFIAFSQEMAIQGVYEKQLKYCYKAQKVEAKLKASGFDEHRLKVFSALLAEQFGYYYGNKSLIHEAIKRHKKTLNLRYKAYRTKNKNHYSIAHSINNLGFCYRKQNKTDAAIKKHEEAKKMLLCQFEPTNYYYFARIEINIAVCERKKGHFEEALKRFFAVKNLRTEFFGENHRLIAKVNLNIARCLLKLGKVVEAEKMFKATLETYKTFYPKKVMRAHSNISKMYIHYGECLFILQEYSAASSIFTMALNTLKANSEYDESVEVEILYNISEAERKKKRPETEEGKINQAMNIARKIGDELLLAKGYFLFGCVFFDKKDYSNAAQNQKKALDIRCKHLKDRHPDLLKNYNYLAQNYIQLGKLDEALKYLETADTNFFKPFESMIKKKIGQMKYKLARNRIISFSLSRFYMTKSQNKRFIFETWVLQAECYFKMYQKDNSRLDTLQQGYEIFKKFVLPISEEFINNYSSEPLIQLYATKCKNAFELALEITSELLKLKDGKEDDYLEHLYKFMEKSKSYILNQRILSDLAQKEQVSEEILKEERRIIPQIINIEKRLLHSYERNKQKAFLGRGWKNSLKSFNSELTTIKKTIKKNYPNYYEMKYGDRIVDLKKLQGNIKPESAILTYFYGKRHIYVMGITSDSLHFEQLDIKVNSLERAIKKLNSTIDEFKNQPFSKLAADLYISLIKPLEQPLKDKKHWIIIPDGELYTLSFEVLLTQPSRDKMYLLPYLVKEKMVIYHYSIFLFINRLGQNTASKKLDDIFLGCCPVEFNSNKYSKLGSLPNSEHFLKEVLAPQLKEKGFKTNMLMRKEMNKDKLKDLAPTAKYIHIISHGVNTKDEKPFLFLALGKDGQSVELSLKEVAQLNLNASVVILNTCHSGDGEYNPGNGIAAISRSIWFSGASGVIYTLGEVDEEAMIELTSLFWTFKLEGKGRAEALHLAKIEQLKKPSTSPKHWAKVILMMSWSQTME